MVWGRSKIGAAISQLEKDHALFKQGRMTEAVFESKVSECRKKTKKYLGICVFLDDDIQDILLALEKNRNADIPRLLEGSKRCVAELKENL